MTKEEALKTLKENLCCMCVYGSLDMDSCDIRRCDNRDAIKALEQESIAQWIPVEERLPHDGEQVLCCSDRVTAVCYYHDEVIGVHGERIYPEMWWISPNLTLENVIAWMPLPQPYKKSEDEENA